IDETTPWVLAKNEADHDRLATVLYNLIESITIGASLLEPFMPETTERILRQLNTEKRDYADVDQFGLYPSGNKVTDQPEILFIRKDLKEIMEQVEAKKAASGTASEGTDAAAGGDAAKAGSDAAGAGQEEGAEAEKKAEIHVEPKETITYDDFAKCQFVVGEVISCEAVPKSKKLLKFQIKIGDTTRQILSGIRKWYPEPEKLVGRKVMALINLAPRKMAGLDSEGMLLSAEDADGNVCLMAPSADMPSGSEIC
ncbi:MAG: methionine--tRNA ligase subunit beta, partial [Lachnospiraceae bacterium]|nr:methionine--tRNA ligase subunit beta [Lachnospiraceae bacterium]